MNESKKMGLTIFSAGDENRIREFNKYYNTKFFEYYETDYELPKLFVFIEIATRMKKSIIRRKLQRQLK